VINELLWSKVAKPRGKAMFHTTKEKKERGKLRRKKEVRSVLSAGEGPRGKSARFRKRQRKGQPAISPGEEEKIRPGK